MTQAHSQNDQPETNTGPELLIPKIDPQPVGKNWKTRDAAKHAPSRISSRLYAQVKEVTEALDATERALRRNSLSAETTEFLEGELTAYRRRLVAVREDIPRAARKRSFTDEVKEELRDLRRLTKVLPNAVASLSRQETVIRASKDTDNPDVEHEISDVLDDASFVRTALENGEPGKVRTGVARLQVSTSEAKQ